MDSKAMGIARGRLIKASPWLAPVFGRLIAEERPGLPAPGTDGRRFYCDPGWLAADPDGACAALAHCAMHCLLGHLRLRGADGLALDLAAALLADALVPDFCPAHGRELFLQARHRLAGVPLEGVPDAVARDGFFSERRDALERLLTVDDHRLWTPEAAGPTRGGAGDGWEDLRRIALGGMRGRRAGRTPGDEARPYHPGRVPDRRYRELLARYADCREELREDPDSFEPGLYAYGLERYGNLPLIEPSETREARRLDELAIVIDTSGSCLEALTARFLDETRALLADDTLFARRFNLYILQCDARVRREDHITCLRDFERYIENLRLVGGGGTDFRPAFERVDRLVRRGAFRRLGAALFFTDGMGLFPSAPPEYDAIFVFFKDRYDDIDVPAWARKIVLEEGLDEHT